MGVSLVLQVFSYKPILDKFWPDSGARWSQRITKVCFVLIHLVDFEIFYWISENFDVVMVLEEKSEDHQSH